MKRFIAILFMLLLTAQFVQVTMNLSQSTYTVALDEEQKEKVGKEEGKESKEVISHPFESSSVHYSILSSAHSLPSSRLSKPYLVKPTPPPNYVG